MTAVIYMSKATQKTDQHFAVMDSPIGRLGILADARGIAEIRFPNNLSKDFLNKNASLPSTSLSTATNETKKAEGFIEQAIDQLQAYFDGRLSTFDLPLSLGGTDFQNAVWAQLQNIPYGKTASYKDIAIAVGNPKASRAIGMANNKNRIPIVIPCHRIIGSDGSLTGFAGGLDTKRWLLKREGHVATV